MEILPFLDENEIIDIKTKATDAVSPAHKRFLEDEPVPDDDDVPLVDIDEVIVPIVSIDVFDVPNPLPSLHSPKADPQAKKTKKSKSAKSKKSRKLPSQTMQSHSEIEWFDILPPSEDQGPPPAYDTLQLNTDDEQEAPPAYGTLHLTSDDERGDPPLFDEITWKQTINNQGNASSAAVAYEAPPPEFTEEDLRLQEAIWAERRAKKEAARAAKGQRLIGASAAAASTRADATANGNASSAAVAYEAPPPEFTEEDLRLQEAIWAERRAKKEATRAAKGQRLIGASAAAASTRADASSDQL